MKSRRFLQLKGGSLRCLPAQGLLRAALVCAVMGASTFLVTPAAAVTYVAQLNRVRGKVDVLRRGMPMPGQDGFKLLNGDRVKTSNGRATILFEDASEIRLRKNTEMEINQPSGQITRTLKVFAGRLWAHIRRNRSMTTEFQSGTVVTAIRGTIIEYNYDPLTGILQIGVVEGSLTVKMMVGGKPVDVQINAGEKLLIEVGATSVPTPEEFKAGEVSGELEIDEELEEYEKEEGGVDQPDAGSPGGQQCGTLPTDGN